LKIKNFFKKKSLKKIHFNKKSVKSPKINFISDDPNLSYEEKLGLLQNKELELMKKELELKEKELKIKQSKITQKEFEIYSKYKEKLTNPRHHQLDQMKEEIEKKMKLIKEDIKDSDFLNLDVRSQLKKNFKKSK